MRRPFDYGVGSELQPQVTAGTRVLAPFANRFLSGVVVKLKQQSDIDPKKLKNLVAVHDHTLLFDQSILTFTRWIADYYQCSWGEALNAAMPAGLNAKTEVWHRWSTFPPQAVWLEGLSERLAKRVSILPQWKKSQWQRWRPDAQSVDWLAQQSKTGGPIQVYHALKQQPNKQEEDTQQTEDWVTLLATESSSPSPSSPSSLQPQESKFLKTLEDTETFEPPKIIEAPTNLAKTNRKTRLLQLLQEEGAVSMQRIKTVINQPTAIVKTLAAEGVIAIESRLVTKNDLPASTPPNTLPQVPAEKPEAFLTLNTVQQAAFDSIRQALQQAAYHAFLLKGVTGSGKTEVYLHAVREALQRDKTCLILLPEIALTEAIVSRFKSRFGKQVAVLHSGMDPQQRQQEWLRIYEGSAPVVVGARSAVFAPLQSLGLVVIDEEHDPSYKQEEAPRYHGRDAAVMRASQSKAVVVLGSATPSIESMRNCRLGKFTQLEMKQRIEKRPLPPVHILDLKHMPRQAGSFFFTKTLMAAIRDTLARKEQVLLFLNRRGYATLVRCKGCEQVSLCPQCSIALTWHQFSKKLICHHCEFSSDWLNACSHCHSEQMTALGVGTERVEEEAAMCFPSARVLRVDSDTLRKRGELNRVLRSIHNHEHDIIVGTQILSKGHDYPLITLVAVVLADISLNVADFRSAERTFQLLTQMAGRAGRGDNAGQVMIQTYNPTHHSLVCAGQHDTDTFCAQEMLLREQYDAPPFVSYVLVHISSVDKNQAHQTAIQLAKALQPMPNHCQLLGPSSAPIERIKNRHRFMVLLSAPLRKQLAPCLTEIATWQMAVPATVRIAVDVDPQQML